MNPTASRSSRPWAYRRRPTAGIVSLPFGPGDEIKAVYTGPGGAWTWTELY